jgi:hypothetical protein
MTTTTKIKMKIKMKNKKTLAHTFNQYKKIVIMAATKRVAESTTEPRKRRTPCALFIAVRTNRSHNSGPWRERCIPLKKFNRRERQELRSLSYGDDRGCDEWEDEELRKYGQRLGFVDQDPGHNSDPDLDDCSIEREDAKLGSIFIIASSAQPE